MHQFTRSRGWIVVAAVLSSCNSTPTLNTKSGAADSSGTVAPAGVPQAHWSYTEHGGAAGWSELSTTYALCDSGKAQSPVNLLTGSATDTAADWSLQYKTTALQIAHTENEQELIDNGHTIVVTPEKGSAIIYAGTAYQLIQFHFHTPSEHTINGKHFPMEIHLVHESDDKRLAVIGVLVQEGQQNHNFDQLIKYLPDVQGQKHTYDNVRIPVGMNIPKDLYAYHYVGSLTTPPCTENVQWLVMKNPIPMSPQQIAAFSSRLKQNSRPIQPLNDRITTVDHIITDK